MLLLRRYRQLNIEIRQKGGEKQTGENIQDRGVNDLLIQEKERVLTKTIVQIPVLNKKRNDEKQVLKSESGKDYSEADSCWYSRVVGYAW